MLNLEYNLKEVLRYLGVKGQCVDNNTLNMIDEVYNELLKVISPKYVYKEFDFKKSGEKLFIGDKLFESKSLSKNLENARSVFLMGVTLGQGADILRKKYSLTDTAKSFVAQAVGASLTENLCDRVCSEIQNGKGAELCPRFSSGYGDLDLSTQKDFFDLVDMTKMTGVILSEGYIMSPSKSVTAFVGVKKADG